MPATEATALAHPNIALVKYWGKRDAALNLPAAGSLSITLDRLETRTTVRFSPDLPADGMTLAGQPSPRTLPKVSAVLDLLRADAGTELRAEVTSNNTFPTGAGLASSASGFAALVTAAAAALGSTAPPHRLSEFARRGSGSAARSLIGGFARMHAGTLADGSDAYATQLLGPEQWPLTVVIAVTSRAAKQTGSGDGMERTRLTSPFYDAWVAGIDHQLAEAEAALDRRDFAALASVAEHSCASMHAVMLSSIPALLYWNAATVDCLHTIRALREHAGLGTFFTVDAGPQVKAVCLPHDADRVAAALRDVPGVLEVHTVGLGGGPQVLEPPAASS